MITPRQAACALAVARTGSFRRAAEELGLAQPALSAHVSKLERLLDLRLFVRGAAGTTVSPDGERILPHLATFLDSQQAISDAVARLGADDVPVVRVAGHRLGIRGLLPPALRLLRESIPDVSVTVRGADDGEAMRAVEAGTVDLAFGARLDVTTPVPRSSPGPAIDELVLSRSPLGVFCCASDSLARLDVVRLDDLAGRVVVLVDSALATRLARDLSARIGGMPATWTADDVDIALQLVSEHVGVSPLHEAVGVLAGPGIVFRPLDVGVTIAVTMVRRADQPLAPAADVLWRLLATSQPAGDRDRLSRQVVIEPAATRLSDRGNEHSENGRPHG